jgi:tripartite-type tricarboxylate transporter receptor subunit TctC
MQDQKVEGRQMVAFALANIQVSPKRVLVRLTCVCFTAFLSLALHLPVQAQSWPTRAVKIVIPYPAGGGLDLVGREIASGLQASLGQPVYVENRPGAATAVGATQVAKSDPDGHTILMTSDSTVSINPFVFSKLSYDAEKDLAPVTNVVMMHFLLTAHTSVPANSLPALIDLARKNPGKYTYASYGIGSQPQLVMEMLKAKAQIDLLHVPYKGGPESVRAVIAGDVHLALSNMPTAQNNIQAGLLKAIAIGSEKRSQLMPDVPTFAELGYPEVGAYAWYGMFVPAGVPREVVARIHREVQKIADEPKFKQRQIASGFEVLANSPGDFANYLKVERENRKKAVEITGIKIN